MRTLLAGLLGVSLVAFLGCETKSPPGGPGVRPSSATTPPSTPRAAANDRTAPQSEKPEVVERSTTFRLETPATSTSLKQGEKKEVEIKISRGTNFKENVGLKFTAGANSGLKVDNPPTELKAGENNVRVLIEATKEAALGDHEITVTGTPQTGSPVSVPIKVTVKQG